MEVHADPHHDASPACGPCCTKLIHLGVTLGTTPVLENINLHIHCGELTVLIGPNGAGKTTLLRAILGAVPFTGEVQFIPSEPARRGARLRIGYVPQRLEIDTGSPISVLDLFAGMTSTRPLLLGRSRATRRQAVEILTIVGVPDLIDQNLGRLSTGQLQRVLLGLALTPLPNLLLLDEPISGVDQAGVDIFYHMLAELRRRFDLAILLISHDLAMAAHVADRMLFLQRTVICDGSPKEVMAHPLVRQRFGPKLEAVECIHGLPLSDPAHHHSSRLVGEVRR